QKLLHAQRDAALVRVHFEHADFNFLPYGKKVGRLGDAAPGDFRPVEQSIHAANFDDRAIIGKAPDGAAHGFAFRNLRVAALLVGAQFFLRNHAAVHHHVFFSHVELGDAAADLLPNQLFHFGGFTHAAT